MHITRLSVMMKLQPLLLPSTMGIKLEILCRTCALQEGGRKLTCNQEEEFAWALGRDSPPAPCGSKRSKQLREVFYRDTTAHLLD